RPAFATRRVFAKTAGSGGNLANHPGNSGQQRTGYRSRRGTSAAGLRRTPHPAALRASPHRAPAAYRKNPSLRRRAGSSGRSPSAHRMRGLFVTGTDTGVGKTVVSAALLCRYPGARYWKPVQTGTDTDDDTAEVLRLAERDQHAVRMDGIRLPD